MKAKIPRRYFLIPLLYLAIVAVLITKEFSGSVRIEEYVNNLKVIAEMPARHRGNNNALQKLNLDFDGFILSFERQKPLEFRLTSGRSVFAQLAGYTILSDVVEIDFGNSLTLGIETGNNLQSRMRIDTDLKEGAELVIPFQYPERSSISDLEGLPLLEIRQKDQKKDTVTAVALPANSTIDLENNFFILRKEAEDFSDFYVTRLDEEVEPVTHWFKHQHQLSDATTLGPVPESYLETAHRGWTDARYSATGGTWQMPDSTSRFDESVLTIVLTEALRRGTFAETADRFRNAIQLHSDKTTYYSAPYLGNIVVKSSGIVAADLARITEIEQLISREDPAIFSQSGLLSFLKDRAPTPLFQNLADFAARIDPSTVEPGDVPGILTVYLESRDIEDPLTAAFDGFRQTVETALLPAIRLTDRGYFIAVRKDTIDVKNSTRAGVVLKLIGSRENNELFEIIGTALVSSALHLSEPEGFLPAVLQTDERTVIGASGTVKPEELYSFIAGHRYYPKHLSLTAHLGSPAWVWTSAESFEAQRIGSEVRISFEYPVGRTHHFMLHGIEPFSSIRLFGIPWVSDPRFQIYGSGWLYERAEQTLYVKITHSKEQEELIISYE